ncbi:hypothetical protein D3C85_989100 [compost metagenome]
MTVVYRRLEGMALTFVSGTLEQNDERMLSYAVTFRMSLDFVHFLHMSNQFLSGYLDDPVNAIRPELGGLAYHYSYNYFFSAAGDIRSSADLFKVFASPYYYMDAWSTGGLERRYGKPAFRHVGEQLEVTVRRDFRWEDGAPIYVKDLPLITFDWSLNVMQGHSSQKPKPKLKPKLAPGSIVIFGYTEAETVEIGGVPVRKRMRYMVGSELQLGAILPEQILTAE